MKTLLKSVRCLECGHEMEADLYAVQCGACGGAWLDAGYDLAMLPADWPCVVGERPCGWCFLPSSVPAEKMRELALYGAEVVKITGTYDQTKEIAVDFAARRGITYVRGAKTIPGKESMKTIAFEIVEQMGWQAPDWYIQAVSGGIGPLGVLKGFIELHEAGLIDRVPKIGVVQVEGCAPMVRAWEERLVEANPVHPDTLVIVLATGNPGLAYRILKEANDQHGGAMVSVSMLHLEMEVPTTAARSTDGMMAPLEQLDEQITTILIIEDIPHDSRLLRRLLQRFKRYRVLEAHNGPDGLDLVRQRRPDLVMLDLTMPENVPVVVVSAKDIDPMLRNKLVAQADSIWLKGMLDRSSLLAYIETILPE